MRTRTKIGMAVAAIAMGLISPAAKAVITNGSFESGDLTGFTSVGDATVLDSSYNPSQGSFIGGITNVGIANGTLSGTPAVVVPNISTLDAAAHLPAGTLTALNVKSGSVLSQSFFATAGDTVTFTSNFVTNEQVAGGNPDQGFYTLLLPGATNAALVTLGTPTTATTLPPANNAQSGIYDFAQGGTGRETGNVSNSIPIALTGLYTISFGVVNVNDTTFSSALLIDNLAGATGNASGVPLPLAAFIAPLGLAVAGRYSKKFRRQQA